MIHDIIFLVLGLALIILGGNYVTDGAVAIADRFKISSLLVGLTVVAFGSSTPDLVVSVMATAQGKTQLAIGDVVGADIFDFLLVAGVMAIIAPIPVSKISLRLNYPMAALAAVVLFVCADDKLIDNGAADIMTRSDGIIMLLIFGFFMAYTIISARSATPLEPTQPAVKQPKQHSKSSKPIWLAIIMIVGGLAALVIGGNWIVDGASGVALKAGMSEALVGLTIVGIGSSLPDLSTSVIAALKGEPGIAMGNVLGSCIMDILFVLGTCAVIAPLNSVAITIVDYATLMGAAILLWIFASNKKRVISRWQGIILVSLYVAYMTWLVIS